MEFNDFKQTVFEESLTTVEKWDFSLAIEKLIESEEWTQERAELAVVNYKRYMAITKALGGQQLVPNADIDEIWHMHILDTRAYQKDCENLFGAFLHHFPYFGMLSDENRNQWISAQSESEKLWNKLFDENLYLEINNAQKCPQVCPCNMDDTSVNIGLDFNYKVA
ncbi:MAG: glycine-rich domain-containing protein-like [Colwellia sp.]|nr:glycine-rich domain-containing protein-like [Colwellia sp.]